MKCSCKKTKKITNHHLESFINGDINEIMKDYSECSIIILRHNEVIKGLCDIRHFFVNVFQTTPFSDLKIISNIIKRNVAYYTYNFKNPDDNVPLASDTLIIKNCKINVQTVFFGSVLDPTSG